MKISLIICSRNRQQLASECLNSIAHQTSLPDEVVFIEDTAEHQFFSAEKIQVFFSRQLSIQYLKVTDKDIVFSRNLGLKTAHHPVLLYVDDDVTLKRDFVAMLRSLHHQFPRAAGFVPRVNSAYTSIWAEFGSIYMLQNMLQIKNGIHEVLLFASSTFSIKKKLVQKHKLTFRQPYYLTGEDIDFFLRLHEAGDSIFFSPKLVTWHKFRKDLLSFAKTQFSYAKSFAFLAHDHPQYISLEPYLPQTKKQAVLLPFFCFIQSRRLAQQFMTHLQLEKRFFFPAFTQQLVNFMGVYASHLGQQQLKKRLRQLLFT